MLDESLRGLKDKLLMPTYFLFKEFEPNTLTLMAFGFGLFACFSVHRSSSLSLLFWILNRIFDGLDGFIARLAKKQTDFGGYLDIICDFFIYSFLPIFVANAAQDHNLWIAVAFFEAICFVNAASLFMLAGIIEKRKSQGKISKKELTTLVMPPGLIEGFETIIFFSLFILTPSVILVAAFTTMISINILQRLYWAKNNI